MFLSITNETRKVPVADAVRVAHSVTARAVGLLWTPTLAPHEGLWLSPCTSIHTFFMRYPIDAIFLDADHRVLHITTLAPWRLSRWIPKAAGVLEIVVGQARKAQLEVGDRLTFKERA